MADTPNLREVNARRRSLQFVGRTQQIAAFMNNLGLPVDERRYVWNLHGQGGVGKTTLLKRLLAQAADYGALTAFTDESASDPVAVMAAVSREFSQRGARLKAFDERHSRLLELLKEVQGDPEVPAGLPALIGRTLGRAGVEAARQVPFGETAIDLVGADNIVAAFGDCATFLSKKLKNKDDVALALRPIDILTPLFVAGLSKQAAEQTTVVGFDTYEKTSAYLDSWLRAILQGKFGDVSANTIFLIAGRDKLRDDWAEFLELLQTELLDPVTEDEARALLSGKGIKDRDTIELILRLSGRIPLWLAMLASQSPNGGGVVPDPAGDAVERFLKWVSDDGQRRAALYCAAPRRLDIDIVALLCGGDAPDAVFSWLRTQPFLELKGNAGWVYHDVVRKLMLRHLRMIGEGEWRRINLLLAAHYQKLSAATPSSSLLGSSTRLDDLAKYHRLMASPEEELKTIVPLFLEALSMDRSRAANIAELVTECGELVESWRLKEWGTQMQHAVAVYYTPQWLSAIALFDKVEKELGGDHACAAMAAAEKGNAYSWLNKDDEALTEYSRAVRHSQGDARLYELRGRHLMSMRRWQEAVADFEAAVKHAPEKSRYHEQLARALEHVGRRDDSIAAYTKAIEHSSSPAWLLHDRARMFTACGRVDDAMTDLDAAILADPQHFHYAIRAEFFAGQKRFAEAINDLRRAITIRDAYQESRDAARRPLQVGDEVRFIGHGDYEGQLGQIYVELQQYDEAITEFTKASVLTHKNGAFYRWQLASLLRKLGRNAAASDEWERAERALTEHIEATPADHHRWEMRGDFYADWGKDELSLADYSEALRLQPDDASVLAARGVQHFKMGRCDNALTDLTAALSRDPANARALAERINLFTAIGRYREAIADIDTALLLEDFDHSELKAAKANRLLYIGAYQDACIEFEQIGFENLTIVYHHAVAKAKLAGCDSAQTEIEAVRARVAALLETDDRPWALYFSAGLAALEGRDEQALADLAEALKTESYDGDSDGFADRVRYDPAWQHLQNSPELCTLMKSFGRVTQSQVQNDPARSHMKSPGSS